MKDLDQPDPRQLAIFMRMTPQQKLALVGRLRDDALRLKAMWLRDRYPDDDDERTQKRLRAWQLYGRTDLD
ncbi:MAG TPA: hypothetical protein VKQ06_09625 [Gammaproteobacteria bacterium]|nr:hypothetical protein [Gammaproteobacteria bacterium]